MAVNNGRLGRASRKHSILRVHLGRCNANAKQNRKRSGFPEVVGSHVDVLVDLIACCTSGGMVAQNTYFESKSLDPINSATRTQKLSLSTRISPRATRRPLA